MSLRMSLLCAAAAAAAAVGCSSSSPPPPTTTTTATAPPCTSTDGTTAVNGLLADLTPTLDQAWPQVAKSSGLDPMTNVLVDQKVSLKCSYGGDELCGLQAASCEEEYAVVTVSTITGLSAMQFQDLSSSTVGATAGAQSCPYSPSANGGAYGCSYAGNGTGRASFPSGAQLGAVLGELKVKIKCKTPVIDTTWTETVFSGSAQCTASKPEGSGTFQVCGGACASGSGTSLSYASLSQLDLALGSLSCKVSPSYSPASWIADVLVPVIKDDVIKAVTPPIQKAINKMVAGYLPFASACGS